MAKQPSIFEKFKKSITGPRTPGNPGVITGGRTGSATDNDRAANDPLYGKGESSVNQAIFGPTKAEVESFLKENPVYDYRREDYDPALADIQSLKDRKARAENALERGLLPGSIFGASWSYLDQQKLEELEAAYGGGEKEKTTVEQKTDEITDLATKITTKSSGVSAGPAQDAAEEFKEKGRKSTILTSAQGITDEPVTGMLSEGEAEADRKKRLREKRSLLAG